MTNKINKTIPVFAVFIMVLLMIATRGHNNWISVHVHLPDFTLPALLIAGVYFRKFWVVMTLIISAIAIDNYAIVHQGLSANCITPAYSFLPLTYYGVFWVGKFINTLKIESNFLQNVLIVILTMSAQWLAATASYYAFTTSPWVDFPTYAAHWSLVEISTILYWMLAVFIVFTLVPRIIPTLNFRHSVGK